VQNSRFRRVLLSVVVLALAAVAAEAFRIAWLLRRPVHVKDGFEQPNLSSIWTTWRMEPGSFSIQSEIVHSGNHAAQIVLRPGDRFEKASASGSASERDELMEVPRWWSQSGKTYEYAFSLYLPRDFPIVQKRLVIAQWKQLCEWVSCSPDNPVLAIRYVGGILFVTRKNDAGETTMYRSQGEMRGRWLDFRFITRFSPADDGLLSGWMNGQQIVQYHGVTAYAAARGYPTRGFFYFKMGLYRDLMKPPMTIYLDDFRKDQCETPSCGETEMPHAGR